MTHEQIKAALAREIGDAILGKTATSGSNDASSAVMALIGPKPLVWAIRTDTFNDVYTSGQYWVGKTKSGWVVTGCIFFVGKRYPDRETAQAAAQSHADAAHWGNTALADMIGGE